MQNERELRARRVLKKLLRRLLHDRHDVLNVESTWNAFPRTRDVFVARHAYDTAHDFVRGDSLCGGCPSSFIIRPSRQEEENVARLTRRGRRAAAVNVDRPLPRRGSARCGHKRGELEARGGGGSYQGHGMRMIERRGEGERYLGEMHYFYRGRKSQHLHRGKLWYGYLVRVCLFFTRACRRSRQRRRRRHRHLHRHRHNHHRLTDA